MDGSLLQFMLRSEGGDMSIYALPSHPGFAVSHEYLSALAMTLEEYDRLPRELIEQVGKAARREGTNKIEISHEQKRKLALGRFTPPFRFVGSYLRDSKNSYVADYRFWTTTAHREYPELELIGQMIAEAMNDFWAKQLNETGWSEK
jgi:hypothetical protein